MVACQHAKAVCAPGSYGRFRAVARATAFFLGFVMKVLTWAVRLAIFLFLFIFALQNTAPVTLQFVLGKVWQAPLVILLLSFFAAGALFGVLSLLSHLFAQRREIIQLKKALAMAPTAPVEVAQPPAPEL